MGDWRSAPCFYVSVIDGPSWGLLAGPFPAHGLALDLVDKVKEAACQVDQKAWFYAFGTCRVRAGGQKDGTLNEKIGYDGIIRKWEAEDAAHQAWLEKERSLQKGAS